MVQREREDLGRTKIGIYKCHEELGWRVGDRVSTLDRERTFQKVFFKGLPEKQPWKYPKKDGSKENKQQV